MENLFNFNYMLLINHNQDNKDCVKSIWYFECVWEQFYGNGTLVRNFALEVSVRCINLYKTMTVEWMLNVKCFLLRHLPQLLCYYDFYVINTLL